MAIPIAEFDIKNVLFKTPEEKTVTMSNGQNIVMTEIQIKYKKGEKEIPLALDLPVTRTDFNGVTIFGKEDGGSSHSVKIFFPKYQPRWIDDDEDSGHFEESPTYVDDDGVEHPNDYVEMDQVRDIFDQVYEAGIDFTFANKSKVKDFLKCQDKTFIGFTIPSPLYYPTGEDGVTPDLNKVPSTFFNFIESGSKNPKYPNKVFTYFVGADGKKMELTELVDKQIFLKPTVTIERIFIGAKKKFVTKISKAIVFDCVEKDTLARDKEKIAEMVAENPTMAKAFMRKMEKMRDAAKKAPSTTEENKTTEETSTNSASPPIEESQRSPSPTPKEESPTEPVKTATETLTEHMTKQQTDVPRRTIVRKPKP